MPKFTKLIDDGLTTGLRVEEYREEDDLEKLAIRLAECLNASRRKRKDAEGFNNSARAELQMCQQLQHVIFQVRERDRERARAKREAEARGEEYVPPKPKSRMDPMETYDLKMCEDEFRERRERGNKMLQQADEFKREADELEKEADEIQKRIRQAHVEAGRIKRAHTAATNR